MEKLDTLINNAAQALTDLVELSYRAGGAASRNSRQWVCSDGRRICIPSRTGGAPGIVGSEQTSILLDNGTEAQS